MPKEDAYVKENDSTASKEERMTRLKFELREHVRFLDGYEIMSTDWLRMAESLNQIANVAFMETHLPPSESNPLQQCGKKSKGTLWDQEKDELAVRIILEEGKLNLAFRILHSYMRFKRGPTFASAIKEACATYKSPEDKVKRRCDNLESGVGILLKYTLQHEEAFQIMGLPEFLEHIGEVLQDPIVEEAKDESGKSSQYQCFLVHHYLASLALTMENMDEDRVMDLIEQQNIIPLALKHVVDNRDKLPFACLKRFGVFLSNAMQSEAFVTDATRFIRDEDVKKAVVNVKGLFLDELIEKHGLTKKEVQTLLDKIAWYEKDMGPTTAVPLGREE